MADTNVTATAVAASPKVDIAPPDGAPIGAVLTVGKLRIGLGVEVTMVTVPAKVHGQGRNARKYPRTSYRTHTTRTVGVDDFVWTVDLHTVKVSAGLAGLLTENGDVKVPATVKVEMVGWGAHAKGAANATLYRQNTGRKDADGAPVYYWSTDPASESAQVITDDGRIMGVAVKVAPSGSSLMVSANIRR